MAPEDRTLELSFVEEMGRFFESGGIPRMAGRVWAYMLIADAPHVSAADLAEGLGVSAGSISAATRFLLGLRLVDRVRLIGERRDYFAPRRGAVAELLKGRLERLTAVELLITDALEQFGDREHARGRLDEIHEIYHWYSHELPKLHERFVAQQRGAGAVGTRR